MFSHDGSRLVRPLGLLATLLALALLARPASLAAATTPTISIGDISVNEGSAGTTSATFTIALSTTTNKTVSVNYATANGTATAGSDYVAKSGTASIPSGQLQTTVTVTVNGDAIPEPDETFLVNLSNPINVGFGDSQGQGTIRNDDPYPAISVSDPQVAEGDSGLTDMTFTVSLSAVSPQDVTVGYATSNGTAAAGADYQAQAGAVTISAGQLSAPVTIKVIGDTLDELDETFNLDLSGPVNATIADGQGVGTILDDDQPQVRINDVQALEGSAGLADLTFTVSLSAVSPQDVTVSYTTSNGTAASGTDYQAQTGAATIPAGQLSAPVAVQVVGDTLDEPDETFNLDLSSPVNATIADSRGVGTIIDDDLPPAISVDDRQLIEGNAGVSNMIFNVSLSAPSGKTVTVKYQTADSTAKVPGDYTALKLATLTFQPGVQSLNVSVPVKGDALDEDDEAFTLNRSAPANSAIADSQGVGTIIDDDLPPTLSINDIAAAEPAGGAADATFTVALSAASGKPITVTYTTADGTALAGADYQARAGTLTLLPGELSKPIAVPINSDQVVEPNETFFVDLAGAGNATIAKSRGQGVITSTAGVPTVSIAGGSATEGSAAGVAFLVSLSAPSPQVVTVAYTVTGGTAVAGSDFQVPATLAVSFPPNSVAPQTILVPIVDDPLDESDETFTITLTSATGATIVGGAATGTIVDNDLPPTMTISDPPAVSDAGGPLVAIFNVSLSAPSGETVTVDYQTADGSATAGADYQAQSGMLTILPGQTSATITVPIVADTQREGSESFFVNLGNAVNATLTKSKGAGAIVDQAEAPQYAAYVGIIRR